MSNHEKLMSYMRGWKKGASGSAFTDEEMAILDFAKGHSDGRKASSKAYRRASNVYKCELSPIRLAQPTAPSSAKGGV